MGEGTGLLLNHKPKERKCATCDGDRVPYRPEFVSICQKKSWILETTIDAGLRKMCAWTHHTLSLVLSSDFS